MSKRKLKPIEKVLLAGGVLLAMVPLGVAYLSLGINDEPDWKFPAPIPTPYPNGYDYYLRAEKLITPGRPPVDGILEITAISLNSQQQQARYSLTRRRQWLQANRQGFALLHQALQLPSVEPSAVSKGFTTVHADFRQLGRYQLAVTNTDLMAGDYAGAFGSALDIVKMASDSERGGGTLSLLTSQAIQDMAWPALDSTLEKLSAAQARQYQQRLTHIMEQAWTLQDATRMDKGDALKMLKGLMADPQWRSAPDWRPKDGWKQKLRFRFLPKRKIYENSDFWWDWAIDYAGQPYCAPPPKSTRKDLDALTRELLPAKFVFRLGQLLDAGRRTRLRFLLCRLALRAYYLEHGRYPEKLEEVGLKPEQYADPFPATPAPIQYARQGTGYKLWSIGPDGQNDRGAPIKESWNGFPVLDQKSKGDIVFAR